MITVRPMAGDDAAAVAEILVEMQAHYGTACPPADAVRADLEALRPGSSILVAHAPDPCGIAAVSVIYPGPGLTAGLFLKELYVRAEDRGRGIGSALMRGVAAFARAQGLARVDWTATRSDARLMAFYETLGGRNLAERAFFRLSGPALDVLAEDGDQVPGDGAAPLS